MIFLTVDSDLYSVCGEFKNPYQQGSDMDLFKLNKKIHILAMLLTIWPSKEIGTGQLKQSCTVFLGCSFHALFVGSETKWCIHAYFYKILFFKQVTF